MRREDRYRRYDQFASNSGESTTRRVHRTPAAESDTAPTTQTNTPPEYTPIFQPGRIKRSVTVDPDGTQHANETIEQGNGDYLKYERDQYYAALRRAQEEEQKRLTEERERIRLAREAEKQRQAEERERRRLAREAAKQRRAEERERMRLAAEAEKKRLAKEAEKQRQAEEEEKKRQFKEAAARRTHERNMFVLGNIGNIAETLTNARIRQSNEILRQAREQVQFQDARQREYVGKVNIDRTQRGERFDRNVALTFNRFGLEVPDVETMRQPAISQLTRLDDRKRKSYVGSRLLTGVRRIDDDDIDGYVEFLNGQRLHLPGSDEGYIREVVQVMPHVYVIHINQFTPEFLDSHGYKTRRDPFDCCKDPFGCSIQ